MWTLITRCTSSERSELALRTIKVENLLYEQWMQIICLMNWDKSFIKGNLQWNNWNLDVFVVFILLALNIWNTFCEFQMNAKYTCSSLVYNIYLIILSYIYSNFAHKTTKNKTRKNSNNGYIYQSLSQNECSVSMQIHPITASEWRIKSKQRRDKNTRLNTSVL